MNELFARVLVAYDGSTDSKKALNKAEGIAKQNDAKLIVAYVQDQSPAAPISDQHTIPHGTSMLNQTTNYTTSMPASDSSEQQQVDIMDQQADEILDEAKLKLSNEIDTDYEILLGPPAREIVKFAKDQDVDLVILGNRGLSGLKKIVMGSVSNKVTNDSHCPVLVIK
ncbi:nucleotide-binding universal stress UspA family protein [Alkalibacillus filiformis]|uniref:Nucleotide-binding universal stress UspA family protein n=1 Tax=Alkalibacillus filiformis TaxID=200990 RepID=A0ABU0DPA9_9BACI|nr:universal stress protein [Alkalibacillus filiformis]MDQ0350288.1 nucleotide-binding universal stress UspA family protein [Alkalibacillus filiformis]